MKHSKLADGIEHAVTESKYLPPGVDSDSVSVGGAETNDNALFLWPEPAVSYYAWKLSTAGLFHRRNLVFLCLFAKILSARPHYPEGKVTNCVPQSVKVFVNVLLRNDLALWYPCEVCCCVLTQCHLSSISTSWRSATVPSSRAEDSTCSSSAPSAPMRGCISVPSCAAWGCGTSPTAPTSCGQCSLSLPK